MSLLALLPMLGKAVDRFTPALLTGLLLWNRSDLGVGPLVAGKMSTWADQSGTTNTFVPIGASGPTYLAADPVFGNRPSFNIADTSSNVKTSASVVYGAFTVVLCVQLPLQSVLGDIYAHFTNPIGDIVAESPNVNGVSTAVGRVKNASNVTLAKTAAPHWAESATCQIIMARYDGTAAGSNVRVNGALLAESPLLNNDPGLALFTAPVALFTLDGVQRSLTGKIAELAVYNRYISDTEAGTIEAYMKTLYGIA